MIIFQRRGLFALIVLPVLAFHECLAQSNGTIGNSSNTLSNPVLQEQLDFFFSVLNGANAYNESEYAERFATSFLELVPLEDFMPILADLQAVADDWQVVEILDESSEEGAVLTFAPAATGDPLLMLQIAVSSSTDQVDSLLVGPAEAPVLEDPPKTMAEALDRLTALGHRFAYLVANVDASTSQCRALAGDGIDQPAPTGSMFKLWVLGAVVDAIDEGDISWDDLVILTEEAKSFPSGIVQNDPTGSNRTVRELAELMISISDNTATDLLIHLVGRSAVEQALQSYGHHNPALNTPFLTTKEFFILKLDGTQGDGKPGPLGEQYLNGNEAERRSILAGLQNTTLQSLELDIEAFAMNGTPIAIEELEWFASPMDLCNVMARLVETEEAERILAINPGVPDEKGIWSYIGFKGGSEPGVLGLSWYLVPSNGTKVGNRVVAGALWDPDTALSVSETEAALLMGALRDLSFSEVFTADADVPASPDIVATEPVETEPPNGGSTEPPTEEALNSSGICSWSAMHWHFQVALLMIFYIYL